LACEKGKFSEMFLKIIFGFFVEKIWEKILWESGEFFLLKDAGGVWIGWNSGRGTRFQESYNPRYATFLCRI
jgi:hypothetical protein